MTDELPPASLGASGLQGRPQLPPRPTLLDEPEGYDEHGEPIWASPRAVGKAIPSNCLRVLSSPLPDERGGGCSLDCPGRQRDGGCLTDLVRAANAEGIDWGFEIASDGLTDWWDYVGPPLPEALSGPEEAAQVPSFVCPHCGTENAQDLSNFHYWCGSCGKNGNDPA